MPTAVGQRLTAEFRRSQLSLRARLIRRILALWPTLDPRRVQATTPAWMSVTLPVVLEHRTESARLAADYYTALRAVEVPGEYQRVRWSDFAPTDTTAPAVSLLVTGTAELKKTTARLAGVEDATRLEALERAVTKAAETAVVEVSGAAVRHALDGGREVLRGAAAADRKVTAFVRRSDGDPCYFCALMISRGPVYRNEYAAGKNANSATKSRTGVERTPFVGDGLYKFHDHCACTIEPFFDEDPGMDDTALRYAQIYKDATANVPRGQTLMGAFRAAYDAQR